MEQDYNIGYVVTCSVLQWLLSSYRSCFYGKWIWSVCWCTKTKNLFITSKLSFLYLPSRSIYMMSLEPWRLEHIVKHEYQLVSYDMHYRKHLNFRGPDYFRRLAHENTMLFSSARVTDENVSYFRGPEKIFVGRPTKIRKVFSSASGTDETMCYFRRP